MGKVGEARQEAEKNPSRRIASNYSKTNGITFHGPDGEEKESLSKNGKRLGN